MYSQILLEVVGIAILVLALTKFWRLHRMLAEIPSPKKKFLLHNSLEYLGKTKEQVFKQFERWHHELGDVYQTTLHPLNNPVIFIGDAKISEAISMHQPERSESVAYEGLSRWFGKKGFLFGSLSEYKTRLKPVLNVFKQIHYPRYMRMFNKQSNIVVSKLNNNIEKPLNIFPWAQACTIDVSFEMLMDYNLDAKSGKNLHYLKAIDKFCQAAMVSTFHPISRHPFLHKFTSLHQEEQKALKTLNEFILKIIQDRRKEISEGIESPEWLMLNYYLKNEVDGNMLTDQQIRAELETMIFGSHDTSKVALAFTLYNLAKYPDAQDKLFHEVKALMGTDSNREISEEDLKGLLYMEAVIKESLRMFPPLPYLGRKLKTDITTGGFTFPSGSDIIFSPYIMGRNPKYFTEPLVFRPERFLDTKAPPLGFAAFSLGARKCLGGKVAMMSQKLLLSKLIMNFKFSLTPGNEEIEVLAELSLSTRNGIILMVEKRQFE